MEYTTTSAIILRAIPFKDHQKILTAFSKELGIISIIIKGLSSKKNSKLHLCAPFCEVELVLSKNKGDIFTFHEGSVINLHLPLRDQLSCLHTASSMVNAILESQMPEKPAPLLYSLLSLSLEQIPKFLCQNTLLACFYLKVLKHEGLFCPEMTANAISNKDKENLTTISSVKNFYVLREIRTSLEIIKKIELFFLRQVT